MWVEHVGCEVERCEARAVDLGGEGREEVGRLRRMQLAGQGEGRTECVRWGGMMGWNGAGAGVWAGCKVGKAGGEGWGGWGR
jgi:hypothetical protein